MTHLLPSLEEPVPGTHCPRCNRPVRLAAPLFCAPCFEESLQVREQIVHADLDEARSRARTWQVNKEVRA